MQKTIIKCGDCLAHYPHGNLHICDGLMKELVDFKRKKEEKRTKTQQLIETTVRDLCSVEFRVKSKVREQLQLLALSVGQNLIEKMKKLVTDEIVIAQKEGQPTSRLTALYNKI